MCRLTCLWAMNIGLGAQCLELIMHLKAESKWQSSSTRFEMQSALSLTMNGMVDHQLDRRDQCPVVKSTQLHPMDWIVPHCELVIMSVPLMQQRVQVSLDHHLLQHLSQLQSQMFQLQSQHQHQFRQSRLPMWQQDCKALLVRLAHIQFSETQLINNIHKTSHVEPKRNLLA